MKYKKIDPNAPPQDNGAAELKKVRIKRGLLTAGVFVVLMEAGLSDISRRNDRSAAAFSLL